MVFIRLIGLKGLAIKDDAPACIAEDLFSSKADALTTITGILDNSEFKFFNCLIKLIPFSSSIFTSHNIK